MKFTTTPSFDGDIRRIARRGELSLFRAAVAERFIPAAEAIAAGSSAKWPAALRVKRIQGAPGVWEMTWNFSGPDGRATFEWIEIDGQPAIRWRRAGDHGIFTRP